MRKISRNAMWLFLLGLGDGLRIYLVGLISLSEIVIFVLAPFLFLKHQKEFYNSRFKTLYCLVFLMICGSLLSALYNHTWMFAAVKHCAVMYSIFAYSVVLFLLLRKDFKGIGWLYAGAFVSSIIVIWSFNTAVHMDESIGTAVFADSSVEEVVSGVRFWNTRIANLLRVPIVSAAYLQIPIIYPLLSLPIATGVSLLMTVSGRSDALCSLFAFLLILLGQKSRKRMMLIGRHIVLFTICLFIAVIASKSGYKYLASQGYLGEQARTKYYGQTKQGDSVLRLLMAGRAEFFVGMCAIMDRPIMGFGAMAPDTGGYWANFMWKYADYDDYELFRKLTERNERYGARLLIPVHSFIVGFWGMSGIAGLFFSIYIFYLVYCYFRHYAMCIPQWYGYFSCTLPLLLWSMFFSPYGHGFIMPMLFTALIMARAVGRGWLRLPEELELEARRYA